jgi:hypothetical protein
MEEDMWELSCVRTKHIDGRSDDDDDDDQIALLGVVIMDAMHRARRLCVCLWVTADICLHRWTDRWDVDSPIRTPYIAVQMECKLVRSDDEIDIFIHQEIELIGCMRILSWVHTYHTIAHAHAVSLGAIDDEAQHDIISLPPSECPIRNCRRMRGRLL